MSKNRRCLAHVLALILSWAVLPSACFVLRVPSRNIAVERDANTRVWSAQSRESEVGSLEVVLFGVGDLRTDDHGGLQKSLKRVDSRILPLIVLDEASLANIPGAVAHTQDTACLIAKAIEALKESLKKMDLPLHVDVGSNTTISGLEKVLAPYIGSSEIQIHACDLGVVDNDLKYSPLGNLQHKDLPSGCKLLPWSSELRSAVWEDIEILPDTYDKYTKKYNFEAAQPVSTDPSENLQAEHVDEYTQCPTAEDIANYMQAILNLDPEKCNRESNSGLYRTHWGGLSAESVGECKVQEMLSVFVDNCKEYDDAFAKVPLPCTRNSKSLEHAALLWNIRGDGSSEAPEAKNLIAGELLTRYLLAPLFLGTLSPRRLWWSVKSAPSPLFISPLRTLVETHEWHKVFAAKQLQISSSGGMEYKYFRWHGFLCRYGQQTVVSGSPSSDKEGVMLIHGFGASATQWQRMINSLQVAWQSSPLNDDTVIECLAPDLIGFGQSEKPPITYSGFTWEAYTSDFVKEIACHKNQWQSFVMGGNSIGGFVSMCVAANDATVDPNAISGCGAPGTGRCAGTVLMNPAGVIQTKEDIVAIEASTSDKWRLQSVAQITAADRLAPSKPLPRPVARTVGNVLLSYLRPRIQSICTNLYPTNPAAVDEELCRSILRDSLDPGAINVMISGSKLPTPRTYNEVVAADFGQSSVANPPESQFKGPILLAQGILDPLNDATTRARSLKTLRSGIQVAELQGGHCPHDEIPDEVADAIVSWMKETKSERESFAKQDLQLQS